jgi:hypothetical protein
VTYISPGPPGQIAAVAGKKAGAKQGEAGGILKELGYTTDQVKAGSLQINRSRTHLQISGNDRSTSSDMLAQCTLLYLDRAVLRTRMCAQLRDTN